MAIAAAMHYAFEPGCGSPSVEKMPGEISTGPMRSPQQDHRNVFSDLFPVESLFFDAKM